MFIAFSILQFIHQCGHFLLLFHFTIFLHFLHFYLGFFARILHPEFAFGREESTDWINPNKFNSWTAPTGQKAKKARQHQKSMQKAPTTNEENGIGKNGGRIFTHKKEGQNAKCRGNTWKNEWNLRREKEGDKPDWNIGHPIDSKVYFNLSARLRKGIIRSMESSVAESRQNSWRKSCRKW